MKSFSVQTRERVQMIDITAEVQKAVTETGLQAGLVLVFVPHTTAGVTINENADPDVLHDVLADLERLVPHGQRYYRHGEGNSSGHMMSSMIGCDQMIPLEGGRLVLGTWQGVYFCEFDGPRTRRVHVQVTPSGGRC